ncbi:hypothetical protein SARC_00869 [Sphaeroforma arctica JP610]|uniref:Uncharacterized protein n=1 Tax=Sphaeroforma arctica JP610 TaxID=667725 RepID=A0A0L0GDK7_9EUKA|nr:hypothetical protein SARC_00869 [Sphaeroforma arctica JP610]KNC86976.1 hypothetical protein SARC_00869 [Sphaeroforma arctica JP610]|eukprot:XP_014160878.1 hypothetical protein SARC_00869 [Sphaeroforma arctica JP610]
MTAARGGISELYGHPGVRRIGHGQGLTTSSVAQDSPIDEQRQRKNVANVSSKFIGTGFITISSGYVEGGQMTVKDGVSTSNAIGVQNPSERVSHHSLQGVVDIILEPPKNVIVDHIANSASIDPCDSETERRISMDSADREKIADADFQRFNENSPTDEVVTCIDKYDADFNTSFRFTTSRPATGGGVCKMICELTIMLELCKSLGTRPSKVNMIKAEAISKSGNRFFLESNAKQQRRAFRYHTYLTKFCPPLEETRYQRLRTLYTNWWGCAYRTSNLNVLKDIISDIRQFVGPVIFPLALGLYGLQAPNELSVGRRSSDGTAPLSTAVARRNKSLPVGVPSSQGITRFLRSVTRSCSLGSSSGAVNILAEHMENASDSHSPFSSAPPRSGYVYLQANGTPLGIARLNTLPTSECRRPAKQRCKSMCSSMSPPEQNNRFDRQHASVRIERCTKEPRTSFGSDVHDEHAHIFPMSLHNMDDEDIADARAETILMHSFSQSELLQPAPEEVSRSNRNIGKQPKRWAPRMKKAVKGLSDLSAYSVDMFKRTKKFDIYSPSAVHSANNVTGITLER